MKFFKLIIICIISLSSIFFIRCEDEPSIVHSSGINKDASSQTDRKGKSGRFKVKSAKAFKNRVGKRIYTATYSLADERETTPQLNLVEPVDSSKNLIETIKSFIANLISDLDYDNDPILKQIEWSDGYKYNPLAPYPFEMAGVNKLFKPCVNKETFDSDYAYTLEDSQNYSWIIAQATTINMGESDPARNTFGNIGCPSDLEESQQNLEAGCNEPIFDGKCYHKVRGVSDWEIDKMLNNRRRALMANDPDGGLLYMSIKNPDDGEIYTVRVMHNLHESHILGDGDTIPPNHFTFPIPFCPELGTYYQYNVCNVPRARHNSFGRDNEGDPNAIPHCFPEELSDDDIKEEVARWIVSDIRAGNSRVGNVEEPCGGEEFQWLTKTEFYLDATNSTYLDEGNNFNIGDICGSDGKRGLRKLKKSIIKFRYTNAQEENDPDSEKNGLVLYFDTNPDPEHWFHCGWKDENGDLLENDYRMKPAALTDNDYSCLTSDEEDSLKTNVIHLKYTPLVININHEAGVNLLGLDSDISFVGLPFSQKIASRNSEYDLYIDGNIVTTSFVQTGWIDGSEGDALLVQDLNQNGQVDSSFELFGSGTVMEKSQNWGRFGSYKTESFASNGFIALAQYDENDDLIIDEEDSVWENLMFWQDGKDDTANGLVDEGELLSLDDLGIISFNIKIIMEVDEGDQFGNRTKYRSSYTYMKGDEEHKNIIHDVYFVYKPYSREERTNFYQDQLNNRQGE